MNREIESLNNYLERVKSLKGTKIKMKNPVMRALYEEKSLQIGYWMTIVEFETRLGM